MPAPTPPRLADIGTGPAAMLRRRLIGQVRAVFNDQAKGERPVMRSDNALFDAGTPIWRVHGDVTSMMVGGVAALLLQMLHPAALAGVWDHSNFREDMLGRLRRTARFIAVTTYGDRADAEAAMARVRRIHDHVGGTLADGTPYRAADPHLLAWVHVSEAIGFLDGWQRFGSQPLTRTEQDRYFAQFADIARALGADPVPVTRAEADALLLAYRGELLVDARTREVSRLILSQPSRSALAAPVQAMLMQAAVDLLPPWAAAMHGLPISRVRRPLVHGTTIGMARALRWAFATA